MIKIAYSPIYKYELPEGHRFPMIKYELIPEQLLYEGGGGIQQVNAEVGQCPVWDLGCSSVGVRPVLLQCGSMGLPISRRPPEGDVPSCV